LTTTMPLAASREPLRACSWPAAVDERAARNPHHHRQRAARRARSTTRPGSGGLVADLGVAAAADEGAALRRNGPVLERLADPGPRSGAGRGTCDRPPAARRTDAATPTPGGAAAGALGGVHTVDGSTTTDTSES
jgi:hypothetical protein